MALHWEAKVSIFGEDRAFRRITLADIPVEDEDAFRLGGVCALPERDGKGRGILLVDRSHFDQRTTHRKSMVRN